MTNGSFGRALFPTKSAGSGRVRKNSANDGRGQGRGGTKRIAGCKQCGFPNDIRRIDKSGGDLSGNGGRGPITTATTTGSLLGGGTISETHGDAVNRRGAGCAGCGSKNSVA